MRFIRQDSGRVIRSSQFLYGFDFTDIGTSLMTLSHPNRVAHPLYTPLTGNLRWNRYKTLFLIRLFSHTHKWYNTV